MDKEHEKSNIEQSNEEMDWDAFFSEERNEEWEKEKRRRKKRKSLVVKVTSSLLVFSLLLSGLQIWFDFFNIPAIRFLEVSRRLSDIPDVKEYKKSVVTIEWDGVKGTGFNIEPNGLIVTNEHVVENTDKVNVHFKTGESYTGIVISKSKELDLAIVDIDASKLSTLSVSFEKDLGKWIGEKIIFIGNPLAFTQIANEGTITGKVLLEDWEVPVLMIEAPVYKGNSGSPVINEEGDVIGVIFATISIGESKKRIGVAIPSTYIEDVIQN